MAEVKLQAVRRKEKGKERLKKLRREGGLPGILYAKGEESIPILLPMNEISKMLKERTLSRSVVVNLLIRSDSTSSEIEKSTKALIREIQVDPFGRRLLHMDFQSISMAEKVQVRIPVVIVGTASGVKAGGILEHSLRELEVRCLPSDMPEKVEVDVSNLEIGHSIHVEDISLSGVEIVTEKDRALVTVVPPTTYAEPTPEAVPISEEVAEPELVRKEKKETEIEEESIVSEKGEKGK